MSFKVEVLDLREGSNQEALINFIRKQKIVTVVTNRASEEMLLCGPGDTKSLRQALDIADLLNVRNYDGP